MNKRIVLVCATVCMIFGVGLVRIAHAGWFVDTNVPVNSNNRHDTTTNQTATAIGIRDGRYTDSSGSNSNNKYDSHSNSNNKYDNRQDKSLHAYDSFNTDSHNFTDSRQDNSAKDSYNDYSDKSNNSVNGSYNKNFAVTGDMRNSVLGDFNQLYSGTDFRSGVQGSNNTIDTSSVNITTLGDSLAK